MNDLEVPEKVATKVDEIIADVVAKPEEIRKDIEEERVESASKVVQEALELPKEAE